MMKQFPRTVFVVGAGASREFLLPTGRELLDIISNSVKRHETETGSRLVFKSKDFEHSLYQASAAFDEKLNGTTSLDLMNEVAWISKVCRLAPSIDNLLHAHSSNRLRKLAGKMLIVSAIVEAEKNSLLWPSSSGQTESFFFAKKFNHNDPSDFYEPTKSWLGELFWILVENHTFEEFLAFLKSITFVSFNYDRCIHHFLTNAACLYFDLNRDEAAEVNDALKIIHPYGSLGQLKQRGSEFLGFGGLSAPLHEVAENIKTFTEGLATEADRQQINAALQDANLLCFLGFGYLDLNLEFLFPEGDLEIKQILGTAYQVSRQAKGVIRKFLAERAIFGKTLPVLRSQIIAQYDFTNDDHLSTVALHDMTCRELLQRNRHLFRPARS